MIMAAPALGAPAFPLEAQSLISYDAGSAISVFTAYPDEFEDEQCDQRAGGFSAWLSGPMSHSVKLELSTTVTASVGGHRCALTALPAPSEGEVYSTDTLDDAIPGVSFFATNLAAVFEPARRAKVSPRLRVGGGRLWDKRIWNWFYGAEARIRVGPGAIVTGVERWNLGIDITRETYIWHEDADPEFQGSETVRRTSRPLMLRFGWEGPVW
jgi:hypothetical protein